MRRKSRVTAFTVFELLRENQLVGGGVGVKIPPTQIRVKKLRDVLKNHKKIITIPRGV